MQIHNTDFVPGHRVVESLGLVRGSTIRAKHLGKDILAGLRMLVGGGLRKIDSVDHPVAHIVAESSNPWPKIIVDAEFVFGVAVEVQYAARIGEGARPCCNLVDPRVRVKAIKWVSFDDLENRLRTFPNFERAKPREVVGARGKAMKIVLIHLRLPADIVHRPFIFDFVQG